MKNTKEIIEYLQGLKDGRVEQLETRDFSEIQSVAYGYEFDINAITRVIDIIEQENED